MVDKKTEENIAQFCGITGASVKDARKFIEKYKRFEVAIDAYYNDPNALNATQKHQSSQPSTSKLTSLFDKYKEPDSDEIAVDGTIKLCEDLGVDPEDVVLLAVAYELKSPSLGRWTKQGWIEGWKALGYVCPLPKLRDKLASNPPYFKKVYSHTFDFARTEGARSLGMETAIAFWGLLIPLGLKGGALSHSTAESSDGEDVEMTDASEPGWRNEYTQLWFEFMTEKGGKGVSKDTWNMARLAARRPYLFCLYFLFDSS
ncbi:Cullin binding-domain-containing protein [Mycena floridula]|nr:Cullin binding-domain-containing protein [Mycena floridula]